VISLYRLSRRMLHAFLCHHDIHDLPDGFRRISVEEIRENAPTWMCRCRWCGLGFVVQAEPHFDALVAIACRQRPANDTTASRRHREPAS
jgi:hypothetical protein